MLASAGTHFVDAGEAGESDPASASSPAFVEPLLNRLERIEAALEILVRQRTVKDFYTTAELAEMLGKAEFTVREWCRLGRIGADKKLHGRGAHAEWVISLSEVQRFRREGLLPRR